VPHRPCRIAAFNLNRIYHFVNSVAYAQAAQNHTKLYWHTYDQNVVINAIYSVMFWKDAPGTVEVSQNSQLIEGRRSDLMRHYWTTSLGRLQQGPLALITYLETLDEIKQVSIGSLRETFRDANKLNSQIGEDTQTGIEWLSAIKLSSTVFIAAASGGLTLSGGAAAVSASYVSAGYSVLGTFAKDMASAKHADVMAIDISKQAAKVAGQEKISQTAERSAQKLEKNAETRIARESGLMREAEARINLLSREIARKTSSSKIAKLGRKIGYAEGERAFAQAATVNAQRIVQFAHLAGKALPIVFLAHDVMEGFEEFHKDIGSQEKH
jgi:hypothetical protein